jgi:hypothetical protein
VTLLVLIHCHYATINSSTGMRSSLQAVLTDLPEAFSRVGDPGIPDLPEAVSVIPGSLTLMATNVQSHNSQQRNVDVLKTISLFQAFYIRYTVQLETFHSQEKKRRWENHTRINKYLRQCDERNTKLRYNVL